ncbi:MAG: hypothetical protein HOM61_02435, partial [Candidatus Marinimicrobia bacterium]|nr:hypothetical protein [Candidatus Neomarinimicrobiota bacterium]
MKHLIKILIISTFFGCYSMYGIALQEEKSNFIPTQAHVDYKLKTTEGTAPHSIIFIIADGTGIGQYTVSYYTNGE